MGAIRLLEKLGNALKYHDIYLMTGYGTNAFAYSLDNATTWQTRVVENDYNKCAYWDGAKAFLGGSLNSKVIYSKNGINYICANPNIAEGTVECFCYANGVLVAGLSGNGSQPTLMYSEDRGLTWTSLGNTIFSHACYVIFHDGTKFWAGGGINSNTYAWSTDGKVWIGKGKTLFSNYVYGGGYSGSKYLLAGLDVSKSLAWSSDGLGWSNDSSAKIFSSLGFGVAFSPVLNKWMITGTGANTLATANADLSVISGLGNTVFSTRGIGVYWGKDKFILGGQGTNTLAYSLDAQTVTPYPNTTFGTHGFNGCYIPAILDNVPLTPTYRYLGNSITFGTASSTSDQKWTIVLSKLRQAYNFNYGVPGATVSDVLNNQIPLVPQKQASDALIYVSIGVNNVRANTAVNTFISVLTQIYNALVDKGYNNTNIVIPTLYYFESYGSGSLELVQSYNSAIQDLWNTLGLTIRPDVYNNQGGHDSLAADLLHPNNTGHLNIATHHDSSLS